MNIMVFDTETISIDKPFCYNVGYIIFDTETDTILAECDFVVEQVWHNPMLFSTAFYADKKENYIKSMRGRKTSMDKFGYICQRMIRDIKNFNVVGAYAFNSSFDERVFNFNCDWFKCNNPFDNIPIYDIRGYAHHFICNTLMYKKFCEECERFSDSGNYSTTAESVYQFISGNTDFIEEHTALADSEIELEILIVALNLGAEIGTDYKAFRSITRTTEKTFTVKWNGEVVFEQECETIRYMKKNDTVILKG